MTETGKRKENNFPTYDEVRGLWKTFDIKNSVQLVAYLDSFAILFAYNSGAIENQEITYHDTREIFEKGRVVNYTGNIKTLYEIQNLKNANKVVSEWFDKGKPITQEMIKELHYVLTRGTYDERCWELGERPGQYKKNDIWGIGKNAIAAPVEDIEREIGEALEQIYDIEDNEKALIVATWFHLQFENIHAFADGNGRVGRALMNYYLVTHDHPPIVIYQEDRREYYDALDHFDETGDIQPMQKFLERQLCKTWEPVWQRYRKKTREPEIQHKPSLKIVCEHAQSQFSDRIAASTDRDE